MPKFDAIHSYADFASMDLMRVWTRCRCVYIYEVVWSTKTVVAQKQSDVKKPDICGMIPGVLDVNVSKDVLSPAAVSDSLLMTCFSFPFTLQGFLCAHPNMHEAQTGGWQDVIWESKIPIDAIPCFFNWHAVVCSVVNF